MKPLPLPGDHRFLLRAGPALDPAFRFERFEARGEVLGPDQLNRLAASGEIRCPAALMLGDAAFEIVRMPGVKPSIGTFEDVCPEYHFVPWSTSLDRLDKLGTGFAGDERE